MRRREFIGALGAAAVWRITAHAQERVARIGILLIGGAEPMGPVFKTLQDLGYVEGRNVQFVMRSAQGEANRLPELAAELVSSKVDIIVASLTPSAIAAKNATRNIPIVMAPVGDPVGTGLIVSLARPGRKCNGPVLH
ncbi:MAG: ABC transporter substrate binding protein [Pseudolabrys sp.]